MYIVRFGKQADKDKKLLKGAGLEEKAKKLLHVIAENPFQNPPPYEGLVGNLNEPVVMNGVNYEGTIKVVRMWSHYEDVK